MKVKPLIWRKDGKDMCEYAQTPCCMYEIDYWGKNKHDQHVFAPRFVGWTKQTLAWQVPTAEECRLICATHYHNLIHSCLEPNDED